LLIEKEPQLLKLAKQIIQNDTYRYSVMDFKSMVLDETFDMAIFSYSIGEVSDWQYSIDKAFEVAKTLVIIEPSTPRGFERIREIRQFLIGKSAHIIAPCPHSLACPIEKNKWCHFSKRLSRNKCHKDVKGADLGYEDEKFSYIVASKIPGKRYLNRIIECPRAHSGHMNIKVCNVSGQLNEMVVSKKNKDFYKILKKKQWGDALSIDT
jgi:ribosomal protein RSM22 (predicted rRNA methylase)